MGNRTENSEKNDATSAKIQQMYVGSRETASTCHVLHGHQTVVHTWASSAAAITNTQNNAAMVNPATTVPETVVTKTKDSQSRVSLRRTPRKIKRPTLDPQKDLRLIFKQKLRGAVYDALSNLGVTEHDPLFKPAFKKLFDIVSVLCQRHA